MECYLYFPIHLRRVIIKYRNDIIFALTLYRSTNSYVPLWHRQMFQSAGKCDISMYLQEWHRCLILGLEDSEILHTNQLAIRRAQHIFVVDINCCMFRLIRWALAVCIYEEYTGCPGRNVTYLGTMFLELKYTDITQNTHIQSWTVTEIMAREFWKYDSFLHTYWLSNTY